MEKVAVLGASAHKERYAYKAFQLLEEKGHQVFLVNPRESEIEGKKVYPSLEELSGIDTVTVYLRPAISNQYKDQLLSLKPKRVIFNPGAENEELVASLVENGIATENACTLILLNTQQF